MEDVIGKVILLLKLQVTTRIRKNMSDGKRQEIRNHKRQNKTRCN